MSVISIPLKISSMCAFIHKSKEFALTALYISDFSNEKTGVYACIKCKLHLVKDLKANMLIGNNIFYMEGFFINLSNISIHIQSYNVNIIINAKYYT